MMKRLSRGSGSAASHTEASLVGMPRETQPPDGKVAGSLEPELQREKAHSLICLTTRAVLRQCGAPGHYTSKMSQLAGSVFDHVSNVYKGKYGAKCESL